jgi:hypothetical protein
MSASGRSELAVPCLPRISAKTGARNWSGFGDVAVELDRESVPNVARDDEDDELQRL